MTQPPVPPQQPYPGQQPPYPPQQPPKKKRKWPWIVLAVIAVFIVIGVATGGGDKKEDTTAATDTPAATAAPAAGATPAQTTTTTTTKAAPAKKTVVYEVTSDSGTANNITYFGENAQQSQATDVALPWKSKEFDSKKVTIKGVTAQNGGSGTISCKIIVDGKVEAENSSEGQYAVVSCNGKLF